MATLLGPLLAVLVLAQASSDRTTAGEAVDDQGKPVADVPIVFYVPPAVSGKEYRAEAQTRTDAGGQFRMKPPPLGRMLVNGMNFLAYRPGSALTAKSLYPPPYRLVLRKPEPRTIRIEGPDGQPIAGCGIAPLIVHVFNGNTAEIPGSMADPLAVTTGPDGRATFNYLAARDQLVAVRVSADPIGTQDFLLVERPGRSAVEPVITIRLKKTSRLAGQIVDGSRQPVAGQVVEIWSRGGGNWLRPNPVDLQGGSLRTAADGRFQTPENLLVGSTYRVVVRGPGKDPILSDWIAIGETPRTLLPMRLQALRTVRGRVVDRQGKPVANIEVFQSGDGPAQTSTKTGADGRFSLDGFREGPVFVFVRGEGFRFHGQLIREGEHEVTLELTRGTERPAREMRMLPDLIPAEESRAMARRLVEPVWKVVVEKGDERTKYETLRALSNADSAGVLEKLESAKFLNKIWEFRIQTAVAEALADTDPEEASSVAESIADPAQCAGALIAVVDALPAAERARQLALLDRAALQARAAPDAAERLWQIGDAAERLSELGEVEKAKALFAEGLRLANQMTDKTAYRRAYFAAQLALVDEAGTLAIARELQGIRMGGLTKVVLPLRYLDPAECVQFWKDMGGGFRREREGRFSGSWPRPVRACARRVIAKLPSAAGQDPDVSVYMALAERDRDESASRRLFEEGLRQIDRLMEQRPEQLQGFRAGSLLHVVERIDPALVAEVLWRYVAARPPFANPRTIRTYSPSDLIQHVAWYDREVAAALFESSRDRIEHTEDRELASWSSEFEAWASFDPRGAVARLEKVPVSPDPSPNDARIRVASLLGLSHEQHARTMWSD